MFLPLATEILSPSGGMRFIAPGHPIKTPGEVAPGPPVNTLPEGTIDLPKDLSDLSSPNSSDGGILLTMPDQGSGNGDAPRYAVQYRETDFQVITRGKTPFTCTDPNGNAINATLLFPENSDYASAESFFPHPQSPQGTDHSVMQSSADTTP